MSESSPWDIRFDVQVEALPADLQTLRRTAQAVLHYGSVSQAAVTVTLVGDAQMRRVNRQFLNETSTTDVISFDLTDEFEASRVFDLIVNSDLAVQQARRRGHSPEAELALYIVHGLLHLLGFDDGSPDEARRMHDTEEDLLTQLGFDRVYYSRSPNAES